MKQKGCSYNFLYLDNGDVFVHNYNFYMKTSFPNAAVNLSDGKMCDFFDGELCRFWKTGKDMLKQGGLA